ncbi:TetR/AcrR family transcriptional regulator [Actinomadura atramentaria]|uniref:TetR/AcrR family transcriptional regulator n=1 Tax=Actinomadura atramentaria TaxID=1990 RepID=UPI0003A9A334|nr:TetR/AcrR family transcriptional regulator [Actinomadura atramentaria]
MARPRSFDEAAVLDAAMRAFWDGGYEATSTRDLCAAVGLDRSSVYNAFDSKRGLFLRALARYLDTMAAGQLELLEDVGLSGFERVRALFDRIIESDAEARRASGGQHTALGCLGVNSTVELAARDPDVARLLDRDLARRHAALRAAVAAGQRAGDIRSPRAPDDLARYVNTVIAGMRVAAQGGADSTALRAIASVALDGLNPAPSPAADPSG